MKVGPDSQYQGPNVVPIRPTSSVEASRWPVAGCIVAIAVAMGAMFGAWYVIWRVMVAQIVRLS